jgi:hypothetical protein
MNQHEFEFASAVLDDCRKLIAAGKAQRWDVVKWTVTVNIAVATASIALKDPKIGWLLFWLSVFVAALGAALTISYNFRMTNTRNDSVVPETYLSNNGIDFLAITGRKPKRVGFFYDWQELLFFLLILGASTIPALVASEIESIAFQS